MRGGGLELQLRETRRYMMRYTCYDAGTTGGEVIHGGTYIITECRAVNWRSEPTLVLGYNVRLEVQDRS